MSDFLARSRKAVGAGVVAAGTALMAGMADGSLSQQDWSYIIGGAVVAALVTYFVPNRTASV